MPFLHLLRCGRLPSFYIFRIFLLEYEGIIIGKPEVAITYVLPARHDAELITQPTPLNPHSLLTRVNVLAIKCRSLSCTKNLYLKIVFIGKYSNYSTLLMTAECFIYVDGNEASEGNVLMPDLFISTRAMKVRHHIRGMHTTIC